MTFAAMGKCPRTGQLGVSLTSFSVNAGRVTPRQHGLLPVYSPTGAIVMSHAFGNPQLAHEVFAMLDQGHSLDDLKLELPKTDKYFSYRQLNVITTGGQIMVLTGGNSSHYAGEIIGEKWAVSGNTLTGSAVVLAMAQAMSESVAQDLSERLLRALEAGRDAGGQADTETHQHLPELSGVLFVVDGHSPYPVVDLRVDYHPEAVRHLRSLYEYTKPLDSYYEALRHHPDHLDESAEYAAVKRMPHFDVTKRYDLD
jgi:uncharacterized Ntn-hydrolase superfamily protein